MSNQKSILPDELINLIMCYTSSNTNTIFKNNEFVKYALNNMNEIITEEDKTEYLYEKYSFAQSYFIAISYFIELNPMDEDHFIKSNIYNYAMMDEDYVNTKNEYNRYH
jgi:hypothetical protein